DAAAYQLYLKGRFFWGRRSGDNIQKAIEYFEEAIRQDPNYALAYAGLAEAWITLPGHASARLQDVKPKAKEAALKSLQIDDTLAEAHTALAQVLFFVLDFAGAMKKQSTKSVKDSSSILNLGMPISTLVWRSS